MKSPRGCFKGHRRISSIKIARLCYSIIFRRTYQSASEVDPEQSVSGRSGMFSGASSTEDSDCIEKTAKQEAGTVRFLIPNSRFPLSGHPSSGSYQNLRQTCCWHYEKPGSTYHYAKTPDLDRCRKKKGNVRVQHCPSCHCPLNEIRSSTGRQGYCKNVDAILNEYECEYLLGDCEGQAFKRPQSNLQPSRYPTCAYETVNVHQHRKRQPSTHRRQCRNEEDQAALAMMANLNVNDACYGCPQSGRSGFKGEKITVDGGARTLDGNRETGSRYTHRKRERSLKREPGHHAEESVEWNTCENCEAEKQKDEEYYRTRDTLRFHLPKENTKKTDSKGISNDRSERVKKTSNSSSNPYSWKGCGLQSTLKNKSTNDMQSTSTQNVNDRSKDEESQKKTEDRSCYESYNRSGTRQDSPCRFDEEESTAEKEEPIEDTYQEITVKNEESETRPPSRRSIFAGGDLDLCAHKNEMVGLIERVMGTKIGASLEQQKNLEATGTITGQALSTEIMRVLQTDCGQSLAKGISNHEVGANRMNRLKGLWWEYMKKIQTELTELCNLQKCLDSFSPRQSSAAMLEHGRLDMTEQWTDEQRQQRQHEEKQKLGMIS